MRYSQLTKDKVRSFRAQGFSLNKIKENIHVPITTISSWVQDIKLSESQLTLLKERSQNALQKGRREAQSLKKEERLKKATALFLKGKNDTRELNLKELFIAGVALYWGEGFKNKHEHRLGFCNSDPEMIKFYILWLKKTLGVKTKDMVVRLSLNVSHKLRVKEYEAYWSKLTGIPKRNFTKTFYQSFKWKRQYNSDSYRGVLRIHVKDSLDYLLKMKGWIEGLKFAKIIDA